MQTTRTCGPGGGAGFEILAGVGGGGRELFGPRKKREPPTGVTGRPTAGRCSGRVARAERAGESYGRRSSPLVD